MASSGINRNGINKFMRDLQREIDREARRHPIRVPITTQTPDPTGGLLMRMPTEPQVVNNYHGPVITVQGDVGMVASTSGDGDITQTQTIPASEAYATIAALVEQLRADLAAQDMPAEVREDVDSAAETLLAEVSAPEPSESGVRKALRMLRYPLQAVITGAGEGVGQDAVSWAGTALAALSSITVGQ